LQYIVWTITADPYNCATIEITFNDVFQVEGYNYYGLCSYDYV